jgi:hypothetical protein
MERLQGLKACSTAATPATTSHSVIRRDSESDRGSD